MFRKPRKSDLIEVGRPPSPKGDAKTPFSLSVAPSVPPPRMATKVKSSRQLPLPTIGRQGPSSSSKKPATPRSKLGGKGNGSILSFFKKSDEAGAAEPGLFVEDRRPSSPGQPIVDDENDGLEDGLDDLRFNENGGPVKRRKTSTDGLEEGEPKAPGNTSFTESVPTTRSGPRKSGPFYEESDSEQDEDAPEAVLGVGQQPDGSIIAGEMPQQEEGTAAMIDTESTAVEAPDTASLIKEETSYNPGMEEFEDFGDHDFDEDQFEEGDEYRERRYMMEQARLEAEEDQKDYDLLPGDADPRNDILENEDTPSCPLCSISLAGVCEQDAGVHVNNCLDGNPTPLPKKEKAHGVSTAITIKSEESDSVRQYRRPTRPARPGQVNPFTLDEPTAKAEGGSAFNKLMSGHTEEAAWAEAAASEHAARGKPSYQRTCPFYKILPGLFICVDAFRYGAVKGCQAYFLSHFHSDHYIGLTSTWTHGPIYCSKVTANLVKQQLRVDPQYVIPLEFEEQVDVPGTRGVKVTMISANHCPGSSLYLFEKTVGIKQSGEPRVQRILHCGDFRACKMHVEHRLLMPDVMDKVSGKTREQKIDVCYLDTTYLNPKYAFPNQEAVIKACADMCVCLSKDTADEDDGWETMKRQRAGQGMVKFIQRESSNAEVDNAPADESSTDDMTMEKNPHASQQILSSVKEKRARGRLLVVVGTYSIGKERVCLGIARALDSKIYAPPSKQRIVAALEDPELDARMTKNPKEAQVHMTPLFEIRAETLDDYLKDFWPHFTRAVGFRPSGWNYKPPNSRFTESPLVSTVLHSDNWKSAFSMRDLMPQRGSSSRASCFGVPYSEHSSFRELTMFCCALRIDKIIPTVNVGSAKSREKMKAWCDRWAAEKRKNGLYKIPEDGKW